MKQTAPDLTPRIVGYTSAVLIALLMTPLYLVGWGTQLFGSSARKRK